MASAPMPQFCRHNRLIQNCPICSREQDVEARPLVSSSAPRVAEPRGPSSPAPRRKPVSRAGRSPGVTVLRLRSAVDDGYRSPLVPGLKSSEEAERLAEELAFAESRLRRLAAEPPDLYAEVADPAGELEERTWLAFLIAYLGPTEDDDPFASIRSARTSWAGGELPDLDGLRPGPRSAEDAGQGTRTIEAYRAWAARAGSQAAAIQGEASWSPERRFARIYERLALPGLHRDARFELLLSLGRLGVYALAPGALQVGGADPVTVAAKRALGIGDTMLLERRAAQLARDCGVDLGALDLGFYNWERGERATVGLVGEAGAEPELLSSVRSALGV